MLGAELLRVELRAPPAPRRIGDRLHRAGVARGQEAEALGQDGHLVGVILEDDDLLRQAAKEVAAVANRDGLEPALLSAARPNFAAGEEGLELEPGADPEYGA